MPDIVAIGLRAISFAAVLQAVGVAMFLWLFGASLVRSASTIRSLGVSAAVVGGLLTLAHHLVQPARMTGSFSGIFDGSLQALLLTSDVGATNALRILGLVMLVLGLLKPNRLGEAVSLIGATLVIVSFGLMGHTAAHDQRWVLVTLLVVHLLIIGFWFGALLPLYLAAARETIGNSALVIENFSAIAKWLVPAIFAAGLGMSVLRFGQNKSVRSQTARKRWMRARSSRISRAREERSAAIALLCSSVRDLSVPTREARVSAAMRRALSLRPDTTFVSASRASSRKSFRYR